MVVGVETVTESPKQRRYEARYCQITLQCRGCDLCLIALLLPPLQEQLQPLLEQELLSATKCLQRQQQARPP